MSKPSEPFTAFPFDYPGKSEVAKFLESNPWTKPFRHLTHVGHTGQKRGVLQNTQRYDPFVNEALRHFDNDLRKSLKGFTRTPGDETKLRQALDKYDRPSLSFDNIFHGNDKLRACYEQAYREVFNEFALDRKVVPKFPTAVDLVMDSSSGYPHFQKKSEIRDQILHEGRTWLHHAKSKDFHRLPLLPCSVGVRGALSPEDDPKTRLVWMYPAAVTVAEGVYAQPLIKAIYREKAHLLLVGEETRFRLSKFLSLINEDKHTYGVGLDFSAYDTFPCSDLSRDAFKIMKQNLAFGSYWDPENGTITAGSDDLRNFERVRSRAEHGYDNIMEYFIHTPLILPNGRVVRKHTGVPSGSHFTNLVDSIVNRLLQKTFGLYTGRSLRELRTNGDDSAFIVSDTYVKNILEDASEFFKVWRMTVKPEKSVVAGTPGEMHISGTTWEALRPTRSTKDWLMMALYPSTFVKDANMAFQRLLGIGIAGAFYDAKYCQFFQYFQTGYDCQHGPNLLSWKRLRWLEPVFGINDLPKIYKQKSSVTRIRTLLWAP
nr:MAG: RNA-dependent RNA polymerase [Aspergillus flavus partitivirus 1]BED98284.1 MAG: RNA-dependent RNA polymerase [Aspergillus flavus partitivirus 1]BED98323.1 MAG: RNA-dependent RNA polymerase [Aspergillus flavus partitivirus 1]